MSEEIREEIVACCKYLRLSTIKKLIDEPVEGTPSYEEYLRDLLVAEVDAYKTRAAERRLKTAGFPCMKYLEDLDRDCLPEGIKKRLPDLMSLDFIEKGQNLILSGNSGTGKTHVATGLGIRACKEGYNVLFTTVPYLVTELKECNASKTLRQYEKRFASYDLVILDELGYVSFDREGADLLFANLSLRATTRSMIITSNLTFSRWKEIFGDPALTSALVDRLAYKAILVDMTGNSYRYRETMLENERREKEEETGHATDDNGAAE